MTVKTAKFLQIVAPSGFSQAVDDVRANVEAFLATLSINQILDTKELGGSLVDRQSVYFMTVVYYLVP